MRCYIAESCIACAAFIFSSLGCLCAADTAKPQVSGDVKLLLSSTDNREREEALERLTGQYEATCGQIKAVLMEAASKHKGDDAYSSPLHCAIQAAAAWRVVNTDTLLLSIIDYELDGTSLPAGIDVSGDYFFPAASALVRLRVDTRKVLKAIEVCKNDRELHLLTWVLLQRVGDADETKLVLENAMTKRTKSQNFTKAIAILDRDQDPLPALRKVGSDPKLPTNK